jgi:hypothetical protein
VRLGGQSLSYFAYAGADDAEAKKLLQYLRVGYPSAWCRCSQVVRQARMAESQREVSGWEAAHDNLSELLVLIDQLAEILLIPASLREGPVPKLTNVGSTKGTPRGSLSPWVVAPEA